MLSTGRLHFDDPRSNLFFQLVRVNRLVEQEAHRRSMWHFGMVENVVCDSADQAVFRKETGWDQFLCCAGTISHVRRPRFFWLSSQNFDGCGVMSTPGCGYRTLYFYGKKEPPALWVSPGWSWVSQDDPVSLPTFTRAIPRVRPPRDPAGLYHSPPDAVERWKVDGHRYPPYTYKLEYCLTDGTAARVCGAAEREVLMGFMPGHTCAKRKGVLASQDMRCAAVGNSFHTGVVASILNCCLRPFLPHHRFRVRKKLQRISTRNCPWGRQRFTAGVLIKLQRKIQRLGWIAWNSSRMPSPRLGCHWIFSWWLAFYLNARTEVLMSTWTPLHFTVQIDYHFRLLIPVSGDGRWSRVGPGSVQTISIFWKWRHYITPSNIVAKV